MSLLLAHGHPDADLYPVGMLRDEFIIVVERVNAMEAKRAVLSQQVAATVPNMGIKPATTNRAMDAFQKTIKLLTSGLSNG